MWKAVGTWVMAVLDNQKAATLAICMVVAGITALCHAQVDAGVGGVLTGLAILAHLHDTR